MYNLYMTRSLRKGTGYLTFKGFCKGSFLLQGLMSSPCQQSWPRLVTVLAANTTRLLVVCRKTKQWSPCHELTFLVYHPIAFDIMFVAKGICHKYWRFPALPVFQLLRSRPLIVPKRFISNPFSPMRWFQSSKGVILYNFLLQSIPFQNNIKIGRRSGRKSDF